MTKQLTNLSYFKRLVATAISFSIFGIGGILVRIIYYPLLHIMPIQKKTETILSRKMIYYSFKFFIWFMKFSGIYSYEIIGLNKLNKSGKLFISNHPTLIDVVFLLSKIENCNCVVKEALIKNIFTKGPLLAADYIVQSSPDKLIETCSKSLNNSNNSLLIFPEGTRTKNLNKVKFMKGVANIAITAEKNITPILIKCTPIMLQKGIKWYKIPTIKPHITITTLDDINIDKYIKSSDLMTIKTRKLTKQLEFFFNEKINE